MTDGPITDPLQLIHSPFARLRALLGGVAPGMAPIDMTIGEPRHGVPALLAPALAESIVDYGKYPPIAGTPELTGAIAAWMGRRYRLRNPRIVDGAHAYRHLPVGVRTVLRAASLPGFVLLDLKPDRASKAH